jgi:hypothetical protein
MTPRNACAAISKAIFEGFTVSFIISVFSARPVSGRIDALWILQIFQAMSAEV